jgi:hypothetical protein
MRIKSQTISLEAEQRLNEVISHFRFLQRECFKQKLGIDEILGHCEDVKRCINRDCERCQRLLTKAKHH